jgi:hypothetical protein
VDRDNGSVMSAKREWQRKALIFLFLFYDAPEQAIPTILFRTWDRYLGNPGSLSLPDSMVTVRLKGHISDIS